jgi:ornithine decarboxylase
MVYETELIQDAEYFKALEIIKSGQTEAFAIFNVSSIAARVALWRKLLPMVDIFYAIKANPDEGILRKCLDNKTSFDCASKGEIETMIRLGASPKDIIFAHPAKHE